MGEVPRGDATQTVRIHRHVTLRSLVACLGVGRERVYVGRSTGKAGLQVIVAWHTWGERGCMWDVPPAGPYGSGGRADPMAQLTGGTSARRETPAGAFLRKSRRPGTGAVTYVQTGEEEGVYRPRVGDGRGGCRVWNHTCRDTVLSKMIRTGPDDAVVLPQCRIRQAHLMIQFGPFDAGLPPRLVPAHHLLYELFQVQYTGVLFVPQPAHHLVLGAVHLAELL